MLKILAPVATHGYAPSIIYMPSSWPFLKVYFAIWYNMLSFEQHIFRLHMELQDFTMMVLKFSSRMMEASIGSEPVGAWLDGARAPATRTSSGSSQDSGCRRKSWSRSPPVLRHHRGGLPRLHRFPDRNNDGGGPSIPCRRRDAARPLQRTWRPPRHLVTPGDEPPAVLLRSAESPPGISWTADGGRLLCFEPLTAEL